MFYSNTFCDNVQLSLNSILCLYLNHPSIVYKGCALHNREALRSFSMDLVSGGSVSQPLKKYLKLNATSAHLLLNI